MSDNENIDIHELIADYQQLLHDTFILQQLENELQQLDEEEEEIQRATQQQLDEVILILMEYEDLLGIDILDENAPEDLSNFREIIIETTEMEITNNIKIMDSLWDFDLIAKIEFTRLTIKKTDISTQMYLVAVTDYKYILKSSPSDSEFMKSETQLANDYMITDSYFNNAPPNLESEVQDDNTENESKLDEQTPSPSDDKVNLESKDAAVKSETETQIEAETETQIEAETETENGTKTDSLKIPGMSISTVAPDYYFN